MLAGLLGCLFGVLGILTSGIIFVPLAALCALIGVLSGISRRNTASIGTSVLAAMLSIIGFAVSPSLWLLTAGLFVAAHSGSPSATAQTSPTLVQSQSPSVAATPQPPVDQSGAAIAPATIIARARALDKRIADSNKPKPLSEALKTPLITKVEVEETREALHKIDMRAPEYAEAQRLLASLDRREEEGRRAMEAAAAKVVADDVDGRKAYAKEMERNFLSGGYDVTVSTSGPKSTVLILRFVLFSRPVVYNLVADRDGKETAFPENSRRRGFVKIIFTDGYDKTWAYPLQTTRSMTAAPQKSVAPKANAEPSASASGTCFNGAVWVNCRSSGGKETK